MQNAILRTGGNGVERMSSQPDAVAVGSGLNEVTRELRMAGDG
jgi:hypothetical protein